MKIKPKELNVRIDRTAAAPRDGMAILAEPHLLDYLRITYHLKGVEAFRRAFEDNAHRISIIVGIRDEKP